MGITSKVVDKQPKSKKKSKPKLSRKIKYWMTKNFTW